MLWIREIILFLLVRYSCGCGALISFNSANELQIRY